jgi:uncharacterized membrane protein (DUF485 family)
VSRATRRRARPSARLSRFARRSLGATRGIDLSEEEAKKGEQEMATTEGARAAGSDNHPEFDWQAAERSPEFRELVKRRRAFVVPATIFFLVWYFGFVILAGYASDFMGREFLTDGLTVGYTLALSQFLMTWVLGAWYLRKADREFDPLAKRAADVALRARDDERSRS